MSPTNRARRWLAHLPRASWILLCLIHTPILMAVVIAIAADGPDRARLLSAAAMLIAQGLFLLKALDVRWLRLAAGWQTLIAATVITAIVHGDAMLARAGAGASPATIAVTSIAAAGGLLRHGRQWIGAGRRLLQILMATPHRLRRVLAAAPAVAVSAGAPPLSPAVPRAPPR
jgi:hypothetical protein